MASFATLPAVPMIQDDRCANDLQARGPFRNNGTLPLESTLENWGTSLNVAVDRDRRRSVQIDQLVSRHPLGRHARRRQHAADDPAHALRRAGSQWSQELQLTYQTERADRRVRALLLRAEVGRHRDGRAESAAAGHPARQRQQQGRQQELGGLHAVDVQRDRAARAHRRAAATPRTRRARSRTSSTTRTRPSSRCRRSGIATRSARSRRRRRLRIAGRTTR